MVGKNWPRERGRGRENEREREGHREKEGEGGRREKRGEKEGQGQEGNMIAVVAFVATLDTEHEGNPIVCRHVVRPTSWGLGRAACHDLRHLHVQRRPHTTGCRTHARIGTSLTVQCGSTALQRRVWLQYSRL